MKKFLFLMITIMLIFVTSCKQNQTFKMVSIPNRCYNSEVISIPRDKDKNYYVSSCKFYDGFFYILESEYTDSELPVNRLYKISEKGVVENVTLLDSDRIAIDSKQDIVCGYWAVNDGESMSFYDLDSGREVSSFRMPINYDVINVVDFNNECALLCIDRIMLCDLNGNVLEEILVNNTFQNVYDLFGFVQSNILYICGIYNDKIEYYSIDFESNSLKSELKYSDYFDSASDYCSQYIVNSKGEYYVNFSLGEIQLILDWNNANVYPGEKPISNQFLCVADSDYIAECNEYIDGSCDLVIIGYDETLDYSDSEEIVVGGYGTFSDQTLQYIKYVFNTSQSEYRVVIDDYSIEYGYLNYEEATTQTAALISYFNSDNAPDIYYGYEFDYDYFYDNDMVIDLHPLIENDADFNDDCIDSKIMEIFQNSDGNINSVFSSYCLNGYVAKRGVFSTDYVTVNDLLDTSNSRGVLPISRIMTADIVDGATRYGLRDMYSNSTENAIPYDSMYELVDFSLCYGQHLPANGVELSTIEDIVNNRYLLSQYYGGDLFAYIYYSRIYNCDFSFVGYPSFDTSYHVINTNAQMAISSNTTNADVCWNFIKLMFDEQAQKMELAKSLIPVNIEVLEEFFDAAQHPETYSNEIYSYILDFQNPISESELNNYLSFIGEVDTIVTYDWGVYSIICDEMYSYDLQGRSVEVITNSLIERLDLYVTEHYII